MTRLTKQGSWVAGAVAFAVGAFAAGTRELDAQTERWGYLREMFPQAKDWTEGCAAGDVDGDGDLDLYVAVNAQGFSVPAQDRLFLNDGRGRFTDATSRLPIDSDETYAVALGDIDRDGDLDAVLANVGSPCRIYLNNGQGNFQDAPAWIPAQPTPGPAFHGVALADFDLDGDLDAFFAGETKVLWINQGTSFLDMTPWNLPPGLPNPWTRDVEAGDLDGDGDADLVLGNLGFTGGVPNEIYLNAGNANFVDATATHLPPISRPTWAVDLGDVDGDGDLDLYVANTHNGGQPPEAQDQLFLNVGAGRFVEALNALPAETYNTNDAVFADLDRDGDLDVLAANGHRSALPSQPDLVLRNDGSGTFTASATGFTGSLIEWSTHRWATGDFDADGDTDGVAVAAVETRVFLNRGNAELVDVTNQNPWMTGESLAGGDFDGDGIVDLAGFTMFGSRLRRCMLLRGRGNGEFVDVSTRMANDISNAYSAAVGDLDRDGDVDLVFGTANYFGGLNQLVFAWNDGAGNFATTSSPSLAQPIGKVVLGDLDGDGLLDVAFTTGWALGVTSVFLNRGAGTFAELLGAVPQRLGASVDLALGDLDGDGDLDLFEAKGNAGWFENWVYLNAGNGLFTTASGALPRHVEPSNSVSLGDVDGDGDLDALVGNGILNVNSTSTPVQNRLYLNNGTAVFADGTAFLPPLPLDTTFGVALFDADADGDLDAYIANYREPHRLYRNNGPGRQFSDASSELPAARGSVSDVTILDVDRDGDPDICSGNLGGLVLFNLRRQIARRTPSSLGKSFAMDLYGDAGAPWILLASPGTAAIGLPPFGTLYLDPGNLGIAATGSFDPQGRASVDFRVPRWRALLGQSVYWQAVMNFSPILSNFEITVVTDY